MKVLMQQESATFSRCASKFITSNKKLKRPGKRKKRPASRLLLMKATMMIENQPTKKPEYNQAWSEADPLFSLLYFSSHFPCYKCVRETLELCLFSIRLLDIFCKVTYNILRKENSPLSGGISFTMSASSLERHLSECVLS